MSDESDGNGGDDFDPAAPEERRIGREMVEKSTGLGSVVAHLYRGEMDRATTWRQRLDQTSNWVVTLIAAILTWAFTSENNPHYILIIGMAVTGLFAWIEARRYRGYDVWRSRVRRLQKNLFAEALDPSQGVDDREWRATLSDDYHDPEPKMSILAALEHRLRRVYLPLLSLLLAAWLIRISVFESSTAWFRTASIGIVPGTVVVGVVAAFYAVSVAVALWPKGHRGRRVRGEATGSETQFSDDPD